VVNADTAVPHFDVAYVEKRHLGVIIDDAMDGSVRSGGCLL
jgi:hypothetical protein